TQAEIEFAIAAIGDPNVKYLVVDKGETREVPYNNSTYDISYNGEETEEVDLKRGNDTSYDRNGNKGTVYYDGKNREVKYNRNGQGNNKTAGWYYKSSRKGWQLLPADKYPEIVVGKTEVPKKVYTTVTAAQLAEYQQKEGYQLEEAHIDEGVNYVPVYNLYTNVGVATGTDWNTLMTEIGGDGNMLDYSSTTDGQTYKYKALKTEVPYGQTMNQNERKDGKAFGFKEWDYTYDYGRSFVYCESQGTLRFVDGNWEYLDGKKWTRDQHGSWIQVDNWVKVDDSKTSSQRVKIREVVYVDEYKRDPQHITYWRIDKDPSLVGGQTNYTVYYKVADSETPAQYETSYLVDTFDGISSWSELDTEKTNKSSDLGTVEDYIAKKKAYDEAKEKADKALEKFKEAKGVRDGLVTQVKEAKKELDADIKAKKKAEAELAKAEWNFYWQDLKTAGAKAALDDITAKLAYNAGATAYNQGAKMQVSFKLGEAKAKVREYTYKARVANDLAAKATKAREEAEQARDAYNLIKDSDLGAAALAQAKARLDQAEAAYEAAKAAAEQARKDANDAATEYQQILDRVQDLINKENASKGGDEGGAADTTGDVTTTLLVGEALEETPGLAAGTGVGGVAFTAPGAPGAGEAAGAGEGGQTLNITQQTATSDAVPSTNGDVELTNIDPNVAKAAELADSETLAWWWLVIIAAFGGAGFGLYKKFHGKKEENVTK
ncbi:MAG: hypothetical protein IKY04_02520, partial [Lachnospiraceae bacterium]|nr:hypothetical protein [Lachnospiraceae bacterium]